MQISASIVSNEQSVQTQLSTNGKARAIPLPLKENKLGSAVNGGELLFLALGICFSNDIYREASKRGISIYEVDVKVLGEFGSEGEPGRNIRYQVNIQADASKDEIRDMIIFIDKIAEVHNTIRNGTEITLEIN